MFIGESQHTLDEKGRIRIPVKHKEKLGAKPYITYGEEGCLLIYTHARAKKFIDQMEKEFDDESEFYDKEKTNKYGDLMAGDFCEEDGQGRILLPQLMIAHAGLSKNLITTTGGNHLQLWDEERLMKKRETERLKEDKTKL